MLEKILSEGTEVPGIAHFMEDREDLPPGLPPDKVGLLNRDGSSAQLDNDPSPLSC